MTLTYNQKENLKAILGHAFKIKYSLITIDYKPIVRNNIYKISFKHTKVNNSLDSKLNKYYEENYIKYSLIVNMNNRTYKLISYKKEDINQISIFEENNIQNETYKQVAKEIITLIENELLTIRDLLFRVFIKDNEVYSWSFYFKGNNGNLYFANKNNTLGSIKVTMNDILLGLADIKVYNECYTLVGSELDSDCIILRRNDISALNSNYNAWCKCKLNTPIKQLM